MRVRHVWLALLLACLVVDFANPLLPGVFVFENAHAFTGNAVARSTVTAVQMAPAQGRQSARGAEWEQVGATTAAGPTTAPLRSTRQVEKRYLLRPSDSSSSPSLSPDDH